MAHFLDNLIDAQDVVKFWGEVARSPEFYGTLAEAMRALNKKLGTNHRANTYYEWRKGRYEPSSYVLLHMIKELQSWA